ncbi:hypothetical protein NBRC3257_0029 [Gluconobacter thailandicus NBRC 3257]|uniref:Uncharacterized protein n=1 Tax=Gluconobacter thailandicus NBRC 3257 TaxID=1381097 RepID=A0ABQ0IS31_GLUTH|nr:hypothetical protein AD946_03830 [Gluconobacter thailandicus]GAC86840.1 hypothetical protein NBRC3255_0501 [Gluconobacter thailandicus NBRC 3255]GAD25030.1 hypothetical protein NBRC3257_0029 [Gluconobacter thailandicus NBRC 3257]
MVPPFISAPNTEGRLSWFPARRVDTSSTGSSHAGLYGASKKLTLSGENRASGTELDLEG